MSAVTGEAVERVTAQLIDLLGDRLDGEPQFRQWIPRSERRHRQRLFVGVTVAGVPRFVAKVALDPADAKVSGEWANLMALRGRIDVPEPMGPIERGFVMGHVGTGDLPTALADADAERWHELLQRSVATAATVHGSVPVAVGAPTGGTHDLSGLPDVTLSAVARSRRGPVHGDLGPWNVQVDEAGATRLLDWEDYQPDGLVGLDVLNLVLTAGLIAYPAYRERGFAWLFDRMYGDEGPYQSAARSALQRYGELTGESPEHVLALTPVFCAAMEHRIAAEGRPTEHLFFGPLRRRFTARPDEHLAVGR